MENNETLKVGQVFRVFEITPEFYVDSITGRWFSECNDGHLGNEFGINIPESLPYGTSGLHVGIDDRNEGKLVGKLRITKVK